MYQAFAMEAQGDATPCCLNVILLVQLSLDMKNGGVINRGHYSHNISTALYFIKMCAENMIPHQVCVTITPF